MLHMWVILEKHFRAYYPFFFVYNSIKLILLRLLLLRSAQGSLVFCFLACQDWGGGGGGEADEHVHSFPCFIPLTFTCTFGTPRSIVLISRLGPICWTVFHMKAPVSAEVYRVIP